MGIEVIVPEKEISELAQRLTSLGKKVTGAKILNKIALDAKNAIFLRTQAGKDVNFVRFKPYSKKYAREEGKTTVNLTQTGEMLNSMTQKVLSNTVAKIFFNTPRARKLADIHNNLGAGRSRVIREFFGINPKDRQRAQEAYLKEVLRVKRAEGL